MDMLTTYVRMSIKDQVWRLDALCKDLPPNLFYPENNDSATRDTAKAHCKKCPVRVPCLESALLESPQLGIRGGLSSRERIMLRAARNKPSSAA